MEDNENVYYLTTKRGKLYTCTSLLERKYQSPPYNVRRHTENNGVLKML